MLFGSGWLLQHLSSWLLQNLSSWLLQHLCSLANSSFSSCRFRFLSEEPGNCTCRCRCCFGRMLHRRMLHRGMLHRRMLGCRRFLHRREHMLAPIRLLSSSDVVKDFDHLGIAFDAKVGTSSGGDVNPTYPLPKGKEQESKTTELLREILFSILVFFPFSFFDLCLCIVLFSYLSSQSFVAFGFLRIVGVFCLLLVYSLILVFSLITCCIVRKVMSFICSFSRLVIGVVMFMSMFM